MDYNSKAIVVDCERMKYEFTGLYYYCLHLANSLLKTNYDNRKFCFYTRPNTKHIFKDQCYINQRFFHKNIFPSLKKYGLWHCTYQSSNYFPFYGKIKVVFTIHDLNILHDPLKTATEKNKFLKELKSKIDRSDHIIAISQYVLNDIKNNIDIGNKPASVIYNGCNINELKLQLPLYKPEYPFLFTIGNIVDKKNFHVLPALLANNDLRLIIAGTTDIAAYKIKIIEEAKKLGVNQRVIFTGSITENDKQWYLKNCEAFVFPSTAEGFGLPVIEAMYFGKPVLLSKFTSLPEVGGDHAYYFNDFEPSTMQKLLSHALEDCQSGKKENLIKERASLFNWNASALQYHNIYKKLLDD